MDGTQPYLYQHDKSTPVLAHEPCKATHERNTYRDDKAARSTLAVSLKGEMLRWEQTKGHSKGTRAWQKINKVFSLHPLYQIEENYWNTYLLTNPEEGTTLQSSH